MPYNKLAQREQLLSREFKRTIADGIRIVSKAGHLEQLGEVLHIVRAV